MNLFKKLLSLSIAFIIIVTNSTTISAIDNTLTKTTSSDLLPISEILSVEVNKKELGPNESFEVSITPKKTYEDLYFITLSYAKPITCKIQTIDLYYNSNSKKYEGSFYINEYEASGEWTVSSISLYNENYSTIEEFDSSYDFSDLSFSTINTNYDNTPPTLDFDSLSIDKTTAKPGDSINISLKALDDISGTKDVHISYKNSATNEFFFVTLYGNKTTHVFQGSYSISSSLSVGTWDVSCISLSDEAGNSTILLSSSNDFSSLSFTLDTTNCDMTPPTLDINSLSIDKKTAYPGDTVTLSLETSDDNSGVNSIDVYYSCPLTNKTRTISMNYDDTEKIYKGTFTVDTYEAAGTWSIDHIFLCDNSYNSTTISSDNYDLSKGNFIVKNDNSDVTPPTLDLNNSYADKESVNLGDSININLKASDNLSGVKFVSITYKTPISNEDYTMYMSYDESTGMYINNINIDTSTEPGEWCVSFIKMIDNANNSSSLYSYDYNFDKLNFTVNNDQYTSNELGVDLKSITLDKTTAIPGETITVSAKIIGDPTIIRYFSLSYINSLTDSYASIEMKYDYNSNTFTGEYYIDEYTSDGDWVLNYISISDIYYNSAQYDSYHYDFSSYTFKVNNENSDTTAPMLDVNSLTINNTNFKYDDIINISLSASDDVSGIKSICLNYEDSTSDETFRLYAEYDDVSKKYICSYPIGYNTKPGNYTLYNIGLDDNANNLIYVYSSDNNWSNMNFTITNDMYDVTAPTLDLSSLKINKKEFNSNEIANISLKATDDCTGISSIQLHYQSSKYYNTKFIDMTYNSATDEFEGSFTINKYEKNDNWSIDYITLSDKAGNNIFMSPSNYDFTSLSFSIINDNEDTTAPVIVPNSLEIDMTEANIYDVIKISLSATDDLSGIANVYLNYSNLTTYEYANIPLIYDDETQKYIGYFYIDEYSYGDWTPINISILDNEGNSLYATAETIDINVLCFTANNNTPYAREDLDKNGSIDENDLDIMSQYYNKTYGDLHWSEKYDFNSDGVIDIYDITILSNLISSH